MSDRATADLLIDQERLSALVGREVRATRLRFKPGLSTSAVLLDAHGDAAPQWIQVSHDAHLDKLRNALRRAQGRGHRVHLVRTGDLTIAHGDIDTDPRLQKGLDGLRELHPFVSAAVTMGDLLVLRYNPQRRLVLRRQLEGQDPEILRVTAHKQARVGDPLAAYAAVGVPVIQPDARHALSHNKRVTVWPWFGLGDLSDLPAPVAIAAAPAAGAALARLHGAHGSGGRVPDPVVALRALVADLDALDPATAVRMSELVDRTSARIGATAWDTGPIHGDFSADQVLVGREGEDAVRLTDFDRAGHGVLLADVGTFAAMELLEISQEQPGTRFEDPTSLPLTGSMLAGYAHAPAAVERPLHGSPLRTWVARALLARATEPFRAADPGWVESIHRRLDQIEEVMQ